jgi:hypothetical protein
MIIGRSFKKGRSRFSPTNPQKDIVLEPNDYRFKSSLDSIKPQVGVKSNWTAGGGMSLPSISSD